MQNGYFAITQSCRRCYKEKALTSWYTMAEPPKLSFQPTTELHEIVVQKHEWPVCADCFRELKAGRGKME